MVWRAFAPYYPNTGRLLVWGNEGGGGGEQQNLGACIIKLFRAAIVAVSH